MSDVRYQMTDIGCQRLCLAQSLDPYYFFQDTLAIG